MTKNDFEIIVNMPDCNNFMFYFKNNIIINYKKKSFIESKNAVVFYNLSNEIQSKIYKFLNPNAIFK